MPVQDHPFYKHWDKANNNLNYLREALDKSLANEGAYKAAQCALQEISNKITAYDNKHAEIGHVHIFEYGNQGVVFICVKCCEFEEVIDYHAAERPSLPKKFLYLVTDGGSAFLTECYSCGHKSEIHVRGAN